MSRKIILEGTAEDELAESDVSAVGNFLGEIGLPGASSFIRDAERQALSTKVVVFEVQPSVSESGSVSYFEVGDIRQAANLLVYMGSPSREFSIQGRFVSRTEEEAERNWRYVQRLRSWRMPEKSDAELNLKTPSRLRLRGLDGWFNAITVRMTSLNIEMPEDVDYIKAPGNGPSVPIVWPVSVSLKEAKSINELREFNITRFRQGDLGGW